jgi:hypothetical protein
MAASTQPLASTGFVQKNSGTGFKQSIWTPHDVVDYHPHQERVLHPKRFSGMYQESNELPNL